MQAIALADRQLIYSLLFVFWVAYLGKVKREITHLIVASIY